MSIIDKYRSRIIELTDELHHYVHEYESLISKRNKSEEKNTVNVKKEKKEKSHQKRI